MMFNILLNFFGEILSHQKSPFLLIFEKTVFELFNIELPKSLFTISMASLFLKLFGFGIEGIDYDAEVNPLVPFDVIDI